MRIATYNVPGRYPLEKRKQDIAVLAKRADIICLQEVRDNDARLTPLGWQFYRPPKAESAALMWRDEIKAVQRGAYKLSSPGDPVRPRYIVWALLEYRGKQRYVGSCHLPAFKTSRPKNAREFRYQASRAADWLKHGRILAGDFNAQPRSTWLAGLRQRARYNIPLVATKGKAKLDHVWVGNAKARGYTVDIMQGVSDHKAVIVELPW